MSWMINPTRTTEFTKNWHVLWFGKNFNGGIPFLTPTNSLRILEKLSIFIMAPSLAFLQPRLNHKAVGKHYIITLKLAFPQPKLTYKAVANFKSECTSPRWAAKLKLQVPPTWKLAGFITPKTGHSHLLSLV